MAIIGIEVEESEKINQFVKEFKEKTKNPDLFSNPYEAYIKKEKDFILIYLRLIWINPIYVAFIGTLIIIMGKGYIPLWTLILTIPLWLGAFAFTKTFSIIALYYSLKKIGYKGKIKFLNDTQLLMRLSNWGRKQ